MKINIINHTSSIGGAEFSLETLISAMPRHFYQYRVAFPAKGPMIARLREKGLRVDIVKHESWRWWVKTPKQTIKFFLALPLQCLSILKWIAYYRATEPDLAHFNINRLIEPVVAARILKIPCVMHFRDIPSKVTYRFIGGQFMLYKFLNLANVWIANSNATFADISCRAGVPVKVVPNALDIEAFDRKKSEKDDNLLSGAGHQVAMIGGINPWKNQKDFIKVATVVLRKRSDVSFYLAGSIVNEEYASTLKGMAEITGNSNRITFLGHVDNIPALLLKLDILVHTMPYESFGRVFIEAMAAGKPVVAYASGGAKEIIVHQKTGILVNEGDTYSMAEAVQTLLDDPKLRTKMGKAGRQRVEKHYSVEKQRETMACIYDQVLEGSMAAQKVKSFRRYDHDK